MKSWLAAVASYPPTWVTVIAVVLAEWVIHRWFNPPVVISGVLILLGLLVLAAWPFALLTTGALNRLRFPAPDLSDEDPEKVARLEADLRSLGSEQGVAQLRMLREKRDTFTEVLKRRLDAGELTFGRYLGTAQRVYVSAINNLHEVAVALTSVSAIDSDYIDRRLSELANDTNQSEVGAIGREQSTLQRRRSLRDEQLKRAADLLAQNESAMTALDSTAAALADAPIGQAPSDAEAAMEQLEKLARRAAKYAER